MMIIQYFHDQIQCKHYSQWLASIKFFYVYPFWQIKCRINSNFQYLCPSHLPTNVTTTTKFVVLKVANIKMSTVVQLYASIRLKQVFNFYLFQTYKQVRKFQFYGAEVCSKTNRFCVSARIKLNHILSMYLLIQTQVLTGFYIYIDY